MAMKTGAFAMIVVLVSAMALIYVTASSAPSVPVNEHTQRQPPPFIVEGYVYEADGVTPAVDCVVNVTDKNTGQWVLTSTDPWGYGWYEAYFNYWEISEGDIFNVTAMKDSQFGWNESVWTGAPQLDMNIILSGVIPEFPSTLVPITGLVCIVVLSGRKRKVV